MKSLRVLLISLALFLNIFGKGLALKCYTCTCSVDCVVNGNINRVTECPKGDNACMTIVSSGDRINKNCWINRSGETEIPGNSPGSTRYFCYDDLCNEGYYNTNGHSDGLGRSGSAGAGASAATPKLTGVAFLMIPFTLTLLIIAKIIN